jgi:hypothetical protein
MGSTLTDLVLSHWEATRRQSSPIVIDGETLDMATTAVFGRYGGRVGLSNEPSVLDRIESCVEVLSRRLQQGKIVYGKPNVPCKVPVQ